MAQKNMSIALLISFFLAGLGIAYVGDVKKGVSIFAAAVILNIISIYAFGFILGVVIFILWIYGLYETYREVKIINGE
ncbi:hypothetical protein [Methanobrevibacter sp.]|uniref:hypothetical protein n=1 Tax=Methanobrevibacter sp. TaxID=66852 RepID=UPI003890A108